MGGPCRPIPSAGPGSPGTARARIRSPKRQENDIQALHAADKGDYAFTNGICAESAVDKCLHRQRPRRRKRSAEKQASGLRAIKVFTYSQAR